MARKKASNTGPIAIALVAVVAIGAGLFFLASGPKEVPKKVVPELMVKVQPLPPPPPPPPPPKEPPPPEPQKMVEAPKMADPMKPAPDQATPKPSNNAPPGPPDLGLAQGDGPGEGFGPSGNGGGGGGGGGGTVEGWYKGVMEAALHEAVSRDGRLKHAKGEVTLRVWLGPDGSVTRVELDGAFTDPSLNPVLQDIVQHQLHPSDPPPAEVQQPIVVRLRARATGAA